MFGRLPGWYTIYIFGVSCPLTEFCQMQNSPCIQVLRSPILTALLHSTRVVGASQPNLVAWYEELNYGTFAPRYFQQTAPPIFRGRLSRLA